MYYILYSILYTVYNIQQSELGQFNTDHLEHEKYILRHIHIIITN